MATDLGDHLPIMLPVGAKTEMRLAGLAGAIAGARIEGSGDVEITGIAADSRHVRPGDLFVAVAGIHSDGHVYVSEAISRGASAVAVERQVGVAPGTPLLV